MHSMLYWDATNAVAFFVFCIFEGSEVSLPGVDERTATIETANKQYQYESKAMLDKALQEQYGQVCGPS